MNTKSLHSVILSVVLIISTVQASNVILTIRPNGENFEDVMKGIRDELKNDFEISEKIITKKSSVEEITEEIKSQRPKLVLLLDNIAIALFKTYQTSLPSKEKLIPSIALMGVLIKDAIKDIHNIEGISYEIPIVTSTVNLRSIIGMQIKKVGIVHREYLNEFLKQNKIYCEKEGIEVIDLVLSKKSHNLDFQLRQGLKKLIYDDHIDVLWVPNDNTLLQSDIIQNVWVPVVRKCKKPVIVGVQNLVSATLDFGTFAVIPDHVSLGGQVAGMIYEIMENGWVCEDHKVDPPLAVNKFINLNQVRKNYQIPEEKLRTVDVKVN